MIDRVVPELLQRHRAVHRAQLVGSRARGDATPLSDWDFDVTISDLAAIEAALPGLLAVLSPLSQGWETLGSQRSYSLLLPGAARVDLCFAGLTQTPRGPWQVAAENLERINHHFWDRLLWIGSKQLRGDVQLVADALAVVHRTILVPLGIERRPLSIGAATAAYRRGLEAAERRLGRAVGRTLDEVVSAELDRFLPSR